MRTTHALLAAMATLTALGASSCGPGSKDFCIETAKVLCQVQYQCCTAVERQTLFGQSNLAIGPYADEGGCVAAFTRQCEASSQAQEEAIAAGRLAFDSARADLCLTGRREAASTCDADAFFNNDDENCVDLVTGLVPDGDPCFNDNECAEAGSECEANPQQNEDGSFTITLEGTCKGQGDLNEECLPGDVCNGELVCLVDELTFERTCQPPRGVGEDCDFDDECAAGLRCRQDPATFATVCTAPSGAGDPCTSASDCSDGLACVQNGDFQNVCGELGAAGTGCSSNDDNCQAGLLCAQAETGSNTVCLSASGAGGACQSGDLQCLPGLNCVFDDEDSINRCFAGIAGDPCDDFDSRPCGPGLFCRFDNVNGRDECQPALAEGAACDPNASVRECGGNLKCTRDESFNFTCQDPLPPNAPCSVTGEDPCGADHRCEFDGTAGEDLCLPRLGAGETCFSDDECEGSLFCDRFNTSTCIGRRIANQTCSTSNDRECQDGLTCRFNDNTTTICRALSAEGQGCQSLADCAAGLDCRGDDTGARSVCRGLSAENQRCDQQADCGTGLDCRPQDATGVNVCRALSEQGEGCENVLDCTAGLQCRFDSNIGDNVCRAPGADGEDCDVDTDCGANLVCRFDNEVGDSVCRALGGEADACSSDTDCVSGLTCRPVDDTFTAFVCTSKKDNGASCEEDGECLSGFCEPDGNFCTEEPPEQDFEICDGL